MAAIEPGNVVTLVIQHKVRPGHVPAYEAWLKRAVSAAEQQNGHLGVNVIRSDGQ
ncbi:antibiotic biosynthesis monooxygenase, partial [Pseudomonas sp. CrR14]|nr:antibiotic biosynthesis monooxygenase [Pseudomonas sp. CrR14]